MPAGEAAWVSADAAYRCGRRLRFANQFLAQDSRLDQVDIQGLALEVRRVRHLSRAGP